jgi:ribosomal protein S18 acetylase RimI-like enzyme
MNVVSAEGGRKRRISPVQIRKARQEDAKAASELLFESAPDMYERFSGGRERALATLRRAFEEPGTLASFEVVWLAELDGRIAAAMAAFPVTEAADRSRNYLGLALRGTPFWRWPGTLRLYAAGGRASPKPRDDSFYIDALATDPALRRRGAAQALLDEAERQARSRSLPAVTLDTTMNNEGARALYAGAGFDEVAYRAPARGLPGFVALVKSVGR